MSFTKPLVSICIITYNSSKYILDTLESAKRQTYNNIELIISDDSSTDTTVKLCQEWIEINSNYFKNTHLITINHNSGISSNCNRAINKSNGEWIKFIAGDDLLDDNCIENFINYVLNNKMSKIIESKAQFFSQEFNKNNFLHIQDNGNDIFFSHDTTADIQYNILLRRNPIHAPSVFINKQILIDVGLYDEKFGYIEDHPMWLKLTKAGYKIYFLDIISVFYRIHNSSVYASSNNNILYNNFYKKRLDFDKMYRLPYLSFVEKMNYYYIFQCYYIIDKIGLNKNNIFCKCTLKIILLLNPFRYLKTY